MKTNFECGQNISLALFLIMQIFLAPKVSSQEYHGLELNENYKSGVEVTKSRPRILLNKTIYANNFSTAKKTILNKMGRDVAAMIENTSPDFAAGKITKGSSYYYDALHASLLTHLMSSPSYLKNQRKHQVDKKDVIRWMVSLAVSIDSFNDEYFLSDDNRMRSTLQLLARFYDWNYKNLSLEQDEILKAIILKKIKLLMTYEYMNEPSLLGGHARWGMSALAEAVISIKGEMNDREDEYLDVLVVKCDEYVNQFNDFQKWISVAGGTHLGWTYGGVESLYDLTNVWQSGTNTTIVDAWQEKTYLWYLYGMLSDGTYFNHGDAYSNEAQLGYFATIEAVGYGNGVAGWFLNKRINNKKYNGGKTIIPNNVSNGKRWAYLKLLMYWDEGIAEVSPDNMPLVHFFDPAGGLIIRDGWGTDSTIFFLASNKFYSFNHNHHDEGSINLHFKSTLLDESGFYDAYGSNHFKNYYIRSIAHNVPLISNDNVYFYKGNRFQEISNDGGQVVSKEVNYIKDILKVENRREGISIIYKENELVYAKINLTDSYQMRAEGEIIREVFFIKRENDCPPVIFVYDFIKAPEFATVSNNFHVNKLADISLKNDKKLVSMGNDSGLKIFTILPLDADIKTFTGSHLYEIDGQYYPPILSKDWYRWKLKDKFRIQIKSAEYQYPIDFLTYFVPYDKINNKEEDYKSSTTQNSIIVSTKSFVFIKNRFNGSDLDVKYTHKDNGDMLFLLSGLRSKSKCSTNIGDEIISFKSNQYGLARIMLSLSYDQEVSFRCNMA